MGLPTMPRDMGMVAKTTANVCIRVKLESQSPVPLAALDTTLHSKLVLQTTTTVMKSFNG